MVRTTSLLILSCTALSFFVLRHDAQAGVIVQAPKALGLERGLVGHWTFDGKTLAGTHAHDTSGQGNHGTLLPAAAAGCPGGTDTYSTAGSFSWPSSWSGIEGCTSMNVQAWGGGAGGVASNGEGGGGGAYSAGAVLVTNGTGYSVIVGAGGTTADAAGGDSSFKDTSTILAKGGTRASGATGGAGGLSSSGAGTTRTSGGSGGNGSGGNPSAGGGGDVRARQRRTGAMETRPRAVRAAHLRRERAATEVITE